MCDAREFCGHHVNFACFATNFTKTTYFISLHILSTFKTTLKNLEKHTASMEQWGSLTKGHDRPNKRFENVKNTRPQASKLDSCDLAKAFR